MIQSLHDFYYINIFIIFSREYYKYLQILHIKISHTQSLNERNILFICYYLLTYFFISSKIISKICICSSVTSLDGARYPTKYPTFPS